MTRIAAKIGAKMEAVVTSAAVPVSIAEIPGLANPPVVADEVSLLVADAPLIAVAVPPPAIIANDQAIAASGIAILSKRLSTQGMKYAKISAKVATPKVITAARLPTHCQFSFKVQISK